MIPMWSYKAKCLFENQKNKQKKTKQYNSVEEKIIRHSTKKKWKKNTFTLSLKTIVCLKTIFMKQFS